MDRGEENYSLCRGSQLLPLASNLARSAFNTNDALIHPKLGLVAGLGAPHPCPAKGGIRISTQILSCMSDPQCLYSFW